MVTRDEPPLKTNHNLNFMCVFARNNKGGFAQLQHLESTQDESQTCVQDTKKNLKMYLDRLHSSLAHRTILQQLWRNVSEIE